jgi:hypothetical protein
MTPSKEEVARKLAEIHFNVEEGMRKIFRYTADPKVESLPTEPIKLLQVNENTFASGTVLPISFGPIKDKGIPYPSVIIEVTPEEFRRIQKHELKLPEGWRHQVELPKPGN